MNKLILYLLCLLPFYMMADPSSAQTELKVIEEKIQALKNLLQENQTTEMDEEVRGQGLMIADWDAYAKDLQKVDKVEERDRVIRLDIQKLEERRSSLMKDQIQSTPQK